MASGAVTLRQIHGTREMLDVHCDRCGRSGRYRVPDGQPFPTPDYEDLVAQVREERALKAKAAE